MNTTAFSPLSLYSLASRLSLVSLFSSFSLLSLLSQLSLLFRLSSASLFSSLPLSTLLIFCTSLIISSPCSASHEPNNPPKSPPSDKFEELNKRAAERYTKSNSAKQDQPEPPAAPVAPPVQLVQPPQKQWSILDYFRSPIGPIMGAHKKFSDEWWNALWSPCKGCGYEERNNRQPIDCKQMLFDNPQWQEVEAMNQKTKDIIMKQALTRFARKKDSCGVACATCAGGNPDSREDEDHHTALHITAGDGGPYHFPLFRLLLKKGADPELACQPAEPINFVHNECREDLNEALERKYNSYNQEDYDYQ